MSLLSSANMFEWEVTSQSSVRMTPLLYLVFLLMYLHKIVSQNVCSPCDVYFTDKCFWTRDRLSI